MRVKNYRDVIRLESTFTSPQDKLPKILSKEQIKSLVGVLDDIRVVMIIFLGIFFGLRIGEMVKLRWSEIDFVKKEMGILDAKNPNRYKSGYGVDRVVPISDLFMPVIKSWRAMNPNEIYVIPYPPLNERDGEKNIEHFKRIVRRFQKKFYSALEKLNLMEVQYLQKDTKPRYKFHLHTLRHVCGCNLRRRGTKMEDIQDYLGHDRIQTTQLYARLVKDDLRENITNALAYPKNWNNNPQLEKNVIEIMPSKEWLNLVSDLKMIFQTKKPMEVVVNGNMSQQTI